MEYPFQEKGFTMSKLSDKIQKKVDQFLDWSYDHPILSTVIVTTGATVGMSALSYGVCTAINNVSNNVSTRRAIKNTRDIAIPNWSDGCLSSAFESKSKIPGKNAFFLTADNVPIESLGKIGGHLESMSGGRDLTDVYVIIGGLVDRNN